ncbi:MAG: hypothetical protein FWC68_04895 [Oscillospiraceae bacterium]|nr:hypothetical protein [Oscillospiraceae bacterium]
MRDKLKVILKTIGWTNFMNTPLSAENLSQMEDNIQEAIDEITQVVNENSTNIDTIKKLIDDNQIDDFVIEHRMVGRDRWRIWASGLMEVWQSHLFSANVNTVWGGGRISARIVPPNYPQPRPFVGLSSVIQTLRARGQDSGMIMTETSANELLIPPRFFIFRSDAMPTVGNWIVETYAVGRWRN